MAPNVNPPTTEELAACAAVLFLIEKVQLLAGSSGDAIATAFALGVRLHRHDPEFAWSMVDVFDNITNRIDFDGEVCPPSDAYDIELLPEAARRDVSRED